MDAEEKIISMLEGRYNYFETEYFDLSESDRDEIAKTIVQQFEFKLRTDKHYREIYTEFVDFKIQSSIESQEYETSDLYTRIKNRIIFLNN